MKRKSNKIAAGSSPIRFVAIAMIVLVVMLPMVFILNEVTATSTNSASFVEGILGPSNMKMMQSVKGSFTIRCYHQVPSTTLTVRLYDPYGNLKQTYTPPYQQNPTDYKYNLWDYWNNTITTNSSGVGYTAIWFYPW